MSKILLDDDHWKVETGGFWRSLWSLVIRDLEYSTFLVTNKRSGEIRRLPYQEQMFLVDFAERVNAVQFSPEFQDKSRSEQKRLSQIVFADCLEAIALSCEGDNSKLEHLQGLKQPELTAHVFALWKF